MGVISHVEHRPIEDNFAAHARKLTTTVYGSTWASEGIPDHELGEDELPPRTAQRLIKDILFSSSRPSMNLASFVTTNNEPEAIELMTDAFAVNMIDVEEYGGHAEVEQRCVKIIANLFHAPPEAFGVSTIGSSEAIILAVLAAKRRWRDQRKAAGKDYSSPNLVMTSAVQVCWEKAVNYTEVEARYIYCTEERFVIDPEAAIEACDENTILVCSVLGLTYTGQYEDTKRLNDLLLAKNKRDGLDIHIHVDGASGGFVVPFVCPELEWDFRLPLVCSINASGHKYGLAYAGVGWLVVRNKTFLPNSLAFTVNYLGADQVSFTLNFSKSSCQVLGQYYQLVRLGRSGYTSIMQNLTTLSDYLAEQISGMDGGKRFTLMSDTGGKGLPLVAWRLRPGHAFDEFAIAHVLREAGWVVPAYTMAPHASKMKMLRIVLRNDFSRDRARTFVRDLKAALERLDKTPKVVLDHQAGERQENKDGNAQTSKHVESHKFADLVRHTLQSQGKTAPIC